MPEWRTGLRLSGRKRVIEDGSIEYNIHCAKYCIIAKLPCGWYASNFLSSRPATFRVLYVFLVLAHERRKVLHFNVSDSPSAAWTPRHQTEVFAYT